MKTECVNCGTELDRPPCRLKANPAQFCDHACHTAYQRRRRVEVACVICGKTKAVAPSTAARTTSPVCSPACESERIRRMRIEHFGSAETRVATCTHCGKEFTRKPSQLARYGKVFCNRKCFASWLGRPEPYAPGFTDEVRDRIRERDGNACRLCGRRWNARSRKLNVHHIDESKSNHDDSNLITLCDPCHRRVHFEKIRLVA